MSADSIFWCINVIVYRHLYMLHILFTLVHSHLDMIERNQHLWELITGLSKSTHKQYCNYTCLRNLHMCTPHCLHLLVCTFIQVARVRPTQAASQSFVGLCSFQGDCLVMPRFTPLSTKVCTGTRSQQHNAHTRKQSLGFVHKGG